MAITRRRVVLPRWFQDEDLLALPVEMRWTFLGLQMYADDYGNESFNPAFLSSHIWPGEGVPSETIVEHTLQLAEAGFLDIYDVGGRTYYTVRNWASWQRVDRATDSKIPPPPSLESDSRATREPLAVEGGSARAGAWAEGGGAAGAEPGGIASRAPRDPSCCPKHPYGTDKPCWACKVAREKHEAWLQNLADSQDLDRELDSGYMG